MKHEAEGLTIERFEHMLDAFGGDPARWPASLRADAEALVAASLPAQRSLAEARALDRLLASPPAAEPARTDRLAASIVAAARLETRRTGLPGAAATARIIELPVGPRRSPAPQAPPSVPVAPRGQRRPPATGLYRAAAAMAASLLFGIAIGLTDLAPSTSALGLASSTDGTAISESDVVLSSLQTDGIDEEQL